MAQPLLVQTRANLRRANNASPKRTGRANQRKAPVQRRAARRKRNFNIWAAKAQLLSAIKSARSNEFAMYRDLRDVGLTWITICAWCDDPDEHGGKRISAYKWAIANAPFGKRWLDEHAEFARAWDHFVVCWKWAQGTEYAPERHPSLSTARDLMDTKKRAETYHSAFSTTRTPVRVVRGPERYNGGAKDEQLVVSPAQQFFAARSRT